MPPDDALLAPEFRNCIALLNARHVSFVLVGGYAMGWHRVVRATGDIDFLYEQTDENVERLCVALREFGAPPELIDPAFLRSPGAVTQLGVPPLRIDRLSEITGVSYDRVRAGAEELELGGEHVFVIRLAELRANKAAAGRPKDREDMRRLPGARSTRGSGGGRGRRNEGGPGPGA